MSIDDLKRLLSLNGVELLDAAAQMLDKQPPSQIARPMTTPQPNLIKPTQDEWWKASDQITSHIEDVRTQMAIVVANWDVPGEFTQYMNSMIKHLQSQQEALRGVSWQLNAAREALDKAKKDTEEKLSEAAVAVIGAIIGAVIGGVFSGGAAAAVVGAGILAGIIAGILAWLVNRRNIQVNQLETQSSVLQSMQNIVRGEGLKKITPPQAPDLSNIRGFSSVHQPDNL
ncbi:hypothetical protein ACFY4C_38190 [Actinomadura viridis]|uniref:hypothetical protein n=1 Tax=Actinomadura viridis TaxID=58110 RepID=UPI0036809B22